MIRYWVETPCEHGDLEPHGIGINARIAGRIDCPGGQRRELTGVEVVEPRYTAAVFDEITGGYRFVNPGRYAIIPLEDPA